MTSIIKVHTFSGAKNEAPLCYLLQVDGDHILLDCGWDERFDTKYLDQLKPFIPKISAVLLSHPDQLHLGALPYIVSRFNLNAPVYATVPVFKMGQMFLYDWVNSHLDVEEFEHFTLDDVDAAFDKVEQVKYNQTVLLKGESGVSFTALPSGHMIGGSMWRISRITGEDIVYCVDFNHKNERHLNGCSFDSINRPHLLITGAHNVSLPQMRRKDRDEQLVTKILRTVRQKGDCMIVIDTAGRVLELAHLLDQLWSNEKAGLSSYNLVMMSHVASSVVQFAKSQLEWMHDSLFKFDTGKVNPYMLKNVHLCHSHLELIRVRSPKVVLCSNQDMESGFSRELFLDWCTDARNGVILTGRPSSFTLGAKLVRLAEKANDGRLNVEDRFLDLKVKKRVALEGEELAEYRRKKAEKDAEEARHRLETLRRNAQMEEDSSDDSDDDMDTSPLPIGRNNSEKDYRRSFLENPADFKDNHTFDILAKWENQQKTSFFKTTKKSFPMFPFMEEKIRCDEYGEIIRPDEYLTVAKLESRVKDEPAEGSDVKQEEDGEKPTAIVAEEYPTKCVEFPHHTEVLCRVEFIEYEGISDGESMKRLLAQTTPRQVIIVHGTVQDTRELYAYFNDNNVAPGKIEAPNTGDWVDASVESYIYQVALSDALLADIQFREVPDGNALAWVDARVIEKEPIEGVEELNTSSENIDVPDEETEPMETDDDVTGEPKKPQEKKRIRGNFMLDVVSSKEIPTHPAVYVNDPKLSEFKNVLTDNGFKAEFHSGQLILNGGLFSIRRCETGLFCLEGGFSKESFRLRKLFYDQFAIV